MKIKKWAALFLAVAIVALWGARPAFALSGEELGKDAEHMADLYLWSGTPKAQAVGPITEAALLEAIPQYRYMNGELTAVDDMTHYPVSAGGEVFGIYVTIEGGGSSFSSEYAEALNDFAEKNDRFCVVYDDAGSWFLNPTGDRELFQYGPGYSDALYNDPAADILRNAQPDLGGVRFWNAKSPAVLGTLRFDPESWRENWDSWGEKAENDELDDDAPFLPLDTTVLGEALESIGDYGFFISSFMRIYHAGLSDYVETGELTLEPQLFEGGQQYVGDLGEDGEYRGTVTFTLDGNAPGIQMYAPGVDESRSIYFQRDKARVADLLGEWNVTAEPEDLSVRLVFVEGMGYVFYADTGNEKALIKTGMKGSGGAFFEDESVVILLDDDFRARAAAKLEQLDREEAELLSTLAPGENPPTAGTVAAVADTSPAREPKSPTVYWAAGFGVVTVMLLAGLIIARKKRP